MTKITKKPANKAANKATAKKAAKKVAKKVAAPKATPKKAPVEKAPKAEKSGQYGVERSHDLPWNDKKVAIFKALKSLRAVGNMNGVSAIAIAEKAEVTPRNVRHYCYHAKAAGLVGLSKVESVAGYAFYLTAKGSKIDPKVEAAK